MESKLYEEVKASSAVCRRYDERCKKLRHQESRGGNQIDIDFTRASVKDLHSRVLVAVHKIGFISKKIQDVRDKYLQPQLDELIGCFTRMWGTMLECHQCQCAIIKLASRSCGLKISFQSESQHQAGFLLSVELRKLCSNFQNWMASQKAYLCSLNMWLHKCMKPLMRRKVSRIRNTVDASLTETAITPIFTTCEMWIKLLDDLPTTDLEEAIEGLIADISRSIPHKEKVPNDEAGGASHGPTDLHPSLLRFMEKLKAFSETSVEKYIDLQENVRAAKERIWIRK
ncbi:protein ROLLING AND ERECT LEAF 2-like [Miscanthus floridulus]|uniref:protein ROLLING AND ERECT LEAF 2-like n=1 Tax=Miscanthus floridulus TaxID=154761 RepID=UPI003458AF0A